jgi:hypothetical protein
MYISNISGSLSNALIELSIWAQVHLGALAEVTSTTDFLLSMIHITKLN